MLLGENFQAERINWHEVESHLAWLNLGIGALETLFADQPEKIEWACKTFRQLVLEQSELYEADRPLVNLSSAYGEVYVRFSQSITDFKLLSGHSEFLKAASEEGVLSQVKTFAEKLFAHKSQLHAWCDWNHYREQALLANLYPLIQQVERGEVDLENIQTHFKYSYAHWWLHQVLDHEPALADLPGKGQSEKIQACQQAKAYYQMLTSEIIQMSLCSQLPSLSDIQSKYSNELAFLRNESTKTKLHCPIRDTLQKVNRMLLFSKPCFLMSPQSVAQYLEMTPHFFDVVILDHSDQLPTCDVVGAIARGKQLIGVGELLKFPINELETVLEVAEPEKRAEAEWPEMIFEACIAMGVPLLKTISMNSVSDTTRPNVNELQPDPFDQEGISSEVSESGAVKRIDSKGTVSVNQGLASVHKQEAEKIVDEIERHYVSSEFEDYSLGIITFDATQQKVIETLLQARRHENKQLDRAIAQDAREKLFIKTFDLVHDDQRDIIVFSLTFGKNAAGELLLNSKPLNSHEGKRILNEAVECARFKVKVFSELPPDEIELINHRVKLPYFKGFCSVL